MKSQHDYSRAIVDNAARLGKSPITLPISDLLYTKTQLDEILVSQYTEMDSIPPPILVISSGDKYKIVDGHHRVEAAKRKKIELIQVFLCGQK